MLFLNFLNAFFIIWKSTLILIYFIFTQTTNLSRWTLYKAFVINYEVQEEKCIERIKFSLKDFRIYNLLVVCCIIIVNVLSILLCLNSSFVIFLLGGEKNTFKDWRIYSLEIGSENNVACTDRERCVYGIWTKKSIWPLLILKY